jgi:uracil-DNA glycosylase
LSPWTKFSSQSHGNPYAKGLIISEAPGTKSIEWGMMWMGAGGQRLRTVLREFGTTLEQEFYIIDTVKCLPPGDRDRTVAES